MQVQSWVSLFEYYKRYKNIVTSMLRKAKENYFKGSLNDAIDNQRKIWRLLNDLVCYGRSMKKKCSCEIKVGDSMNKNPAEVAEHFISLFCSVDL